MRSLILLGATCTLGGTVAAAQAPHSTFLSTTTVIAAASDTTAPIQFQIPAQPLMEALGEYARQARVRVQVDARAAAAARSRPVNGTYTAADALRQLLAGTNLVARFAGVRTALVTRGDTAGAAAYALTPITVIGARSRGYTAPSTTTGTKTDTPLRDVPQSISVITRDAIADQGMQGIADVARYVPGISMGQGEGHRDAPTIRGNSSTADFFVDGVRDDAQYFRDLYNVERVEALKGSNAMIFGRGGGGGIINRVTKEAQWSPTRTLTLEGGSFDHRRGTLDMGQGLGARVAARLNGVYENSNSFRDRFGLERYGINPTVALALGAGTTVHAGYEYFSDDRTVDRGIPSFNGRPSKVDITAFFGNPDVSTATLEMNAASALIEHTGRAGLTIRNRTRFADYDKFYGNSYPGALNAAGTEVTLTAYNSSIGRRNLFNQTDVVLEAGTGPVRHTFLLGAEIGRQETENFRQTGYYNNTSTSVTAPIGQPTIATPITFRQSASDADNRTETTVAGVYLQDQIELSRFLQAVLGVRFDRFAVDFLNRRNSEELDRTDDLVSPRVGLVLKPVDALSLYSSYGVSYLPSAGDQFSSLTATSKTLEPERFTNYEMGAKWDVRSSLALTAAAYRLDRTNTAAPDPNDASRTVQTGSQRTEGIELGASGNVTQAWQVVAGFAAQRAELTSTTNAAKAGTTVPLVPERTFSLWNRYQPFRSVGVGLGVVRQSDMYAAIDNKVTLPGFTRADAALFLRLGARANAQVNVENLLNERYYATSHGNNNILPGAPRTVRASLTLRR